MNQKPVVGIDLDDTLNNLVERLLEPYNETYHDHVQLSDITEYNLHKFLKPSCENVFKEFASKELMGNLLMTPEDQEALTEINRMARLYFVTAGHPITMKVRDQWLMKYCPFYTSNQLIRCAHKQLLKLDIMVDDGLHNLVNGDWFGIVIDKPWNRSSDEFLRIPSISSLPSIIDEFMS